MRIFLTADRSISAHAAKLGDPTVWAHRDKLARVLFPTLSYLGRSLTAL